MSLTAASFLKKSNMISFKVLINNGCVSKRCLFVRNLTSGEETRVRIREQWKTYTDGGCFYLGMFAG